MKNVTVYTTHGKVIEFNCEDPKISEIGMKHRMLIMYNGDQLVGHFASDSAIVISNAPDKENQ